MVVIEEYTLLENEVDRSHKYNEFGVYRHEDGIGFGHGDGSGDGGRERTYRNGTYSSIFCSGYGFGLHGDGHGNYYGNGYGDGAGESDGIWKQSQW
jgi:hypothetical protein